MVEVPESTDIKAAELDDPIDGLRAAVARAVGIGVGQERRLPVEQRLSGPWYLGNRSGRQGIDESLGGPTSFSGFGLVEHVSKAPRSLVGDLGCDAIGVSGERATRTFLLARDESRPARRSCRISNRGSPLRPWWPRVSC